MTNSLKNSKFHLARIQQKFIIKIGYFLDSNAFLIKLIYGTFLDLSNIIMIYLLQHKNKFLRLNNHDFVISLNTKYQIVENLRILNLSNGQSIITLVFGIIGNSLKILPLCFNEPDFQSAVLRVVSFTKINQIFRHFD